MDKSFCLFYQKKLKRKNHFFHENMKKMILNFKKACWFSSQMHRL
ncbi:hypothetical protein D932_02743 [Enterococcus casseliflavus 14-MB-W-14]|nr:hypothetical protein D932_02743 [Enterococcus casseliflavus 14-MB-W-14]